MTKPSEAIKYFKKIMEEPRSNNDTIGLVYSTTKKGESSRSGDKRKIKVKKNKPTRHHYGKLGHIENVCKRSIGNKNPKKKLNEHCHNYKKQGHQAHECRTKTINTQRFEGYYYNL